MHVVLNVQDHLDQMFQNFYDQYVEEENLLYVYYLDQLEQVLIFSFSIKINDYNCQTNTQILPVNRCIFFPTNSLNRFISRCFASSSFVRT